MTGLAVFVALVAALAAVAFFISARSLRQSATQREEQLTAARAEAESVRSEQKSIREQAKEARDEAAKLRAELAAAKKKSFEQAEAAKRAGGANALREDVERLNHRLAESREEAAHAQERARAADAQAAKAQAEIERLRAALAAKPEPVAAPAPVSVVAAAPAAPGVDEQQLAAERDRADKAEAKLAEVRKKLAEVEKDLKGARGRIETEKRVYMVQKGELELANDRYTELRRRYDGLRKDHEELIEAVRQAAREEARLADARAEGTSGSGGANGAPTAT
jgi:chromosome segregation ATPase